jgi:oxygen-independent coproporphyrinogen-3 oxidase
LKDLIKKYNLPGPRYTSYPTVPFWKNDDLSGDQWVASIIRNFDHFKSNEISLYVHLPFCENLCTFCGCHKRITKNHGVEEPYIDTVLKEWSLCLGRLPFRPQIKELHFGGGTPTFFKADELIRLLTGLFSQSAVDPEKCELSFEAHPNNTTVEHLAKLYDFGFRRLSLGIQDYSPTVQKAINRMQSYEQVKKVHEEARSIGYSSISHDLVFGLPKQTLEDIIDSIEKTISLKPDRISLYSYAHVPWIKGVGQRGFDENDLPADEQKRELYEKAKGKLEDFGYVEVGMDHFALPHDSLAVAFKEKDLHRNFMGYTTQDTHFLLGLGMSAISDSWFGFAQNEKHVEDYQNRVNNKEIPVFRGHILSDLDLEVRQYILDLMCHFETTFTHGSSIKNDTIEALDELVKDGLVEIDGNKVVVTQKGVPFVRNVCMAFDQDLKNNEKRERLFSKTI